MVDAQALLRLGNSAVVAPAGHGKTELIALAAAQGRRSLVLTHTHAGVHAIRARLRRMRIPAAQVAVDTIAGWSTRYAYAFPGIANPPEGDPTTSAEWDQLYLGAAQALSVSAIREVVEASYDRVWVDEYQDCGSLQHELIRTIASIVPTTVFGDPMQGIFEFAGATLNWDAEIFPHFSRAGTLTIPHRWAGKNPALGAWIAETRLLLEEGRPIDLQDPRIEVYASDDAFDMGLLFNGLESKQGSFAAIHCSKKLCYSIARAANGGFQAIEEIAANGLMKFAHQWDSATSPAEKFDALRALVDESFRVVDRSGGEPVDPADDAVRVALKEAALGLADDNGAAAAVRFMAIARTRPSWKMYRGGMWRDAERAMNELAAERADSMVAAADRVKQRASNMGRQLPSRTISTPLLLKGLEFDHVVIPDAVHFTKQSQAAAKLFYVAISRATQSLQIGSTSRYLKFPKP